MNPIAALRRPAALALAVSFGMLAATACASTGSHPSGSALTLAQQREPMSLNPALENGTSSMEWGLLLFNYLVKFDDRGRLVGDLATVVPTLSNGGISRDGRTVTYHLRRGVRFADGAPLTARDCAWSIDAINDPRNNVQSRFGYDRIVRAEARDDATLVLHLKSPFAPLLTVVEAPQGFPVLPRHILAPYPDFNRIAFNGQPVGAGPYVVTRWLRGDRVEMRANPYYWRGKPKIDRLTIRFIPDPQSGINLLRTHDLGGYFDEQDPANYPILQRLTGYRVSSTPINGVGALIFNTADPITGDTRVRHALATAIDIPRLIASTYRGALTSVGAGRGLFGWAYDPAAYPDIPYDPAAARRLLDAAGWHAGPDGWRTRDGHTLDLLLVIQAGTPGDAIIGNTIAEEERAVGARVTLKAFNVTQFVAPVDEGGPVYGGKFQMALYPFINGDDPDTTDQFACANVPPHGYNKSRICDPRIDALLRAAQLTFDQAARAALYRRLQVVLAEQLPIALLYQRRQINTFTTRLQGQTTSLSGAFWNAGAWSLAP
jgi:peptide/nickel transport system substrate-binding protein